MKRFVLAASLMALPLLASGGDLSLLDAIRAGDAAAVRARLAAGADVNARDESGATALMYSAIYAQAETMRLLIDGGADANIPNLAGSTALMWAAGDPAKVHLLLDAGAVVRATTASGVTPLLVAFRAGSVDSVGALLAGGADPSVLTPVQLVRTWYQDGGTDMQQVLDAAGAHRVSPEDMTTSLASGSVLFDLPSFDRVLGSGANPATQVRVTTLTIPALGLAAYGGDAAVVGRILGAAVDPNARSSNGVTPLMLAAFSPRESAGLTQLLLSHQADISLRDDAGRTPLDWALTRGETATARLLRDAGAPSSVVTAPPPAVSHARSPREAIAIALARLEPAGPGFFNHTQCISCHSQSLPLMAATRAAAHGIDAGRTVAAQATDSTLTSWKPARENLFLGQSSIGGFVANVTYGLASLADAGTPPSPTTDAVALALATAQRRNGSWRIHDLRPPLGDVSDVPSTALAIRGLTVYTPPGRREELAPRLARARDWLRAATPQSTQDEAFTLMGLVWSAVPRDEIERQRDRLLALQRGDGGWGQLPTMAPDAYATGQALFALSTAGARGVDERYQRGAAYLLRTQLEDGTWFVRSRALGFQAFFESGFPHGRDQFISAAATSWAAIALAESLP